MSDSLPDSGRGSEKQPWYRNPYVEVYWEMEDAAMDVYELALTPIVITGGILAVYVFVVAIGAAFILLGHLILLKLIPSNGNATLLIYTNHSLLGTTKLSSVGAAIIALPAIFTWNYLPSFPRWGRLGLLSGILLKSFLSILYGLISGAAGSGILLYAIPQNSDILPPKAAMVAGALGALIVTPPVVFITLVCLCFSRKPLTGSTTP